MAASDDPLVGRVVDGRYRIDGVLGRGGMGAVYRARQLSVDRDVALKVLRTDKEHGRETARRFEAEARIIARLRHPHTVSLIDFGRLGDDHFLVMELVAGGSLSSRIRARDLPRETAVELMAQVADALHEAHGLGIVHRDLKPGNIMVERVGDRDVARILDFGVAKVADATVQTRAGAVIGTPAYMAPEQVKAGEVGPPADLYALGVTAFEALAGMRPLQADSSYALMLKHVDAPPIALAPLLPSDAPWPAIAELVMALLAKRPVDRPASAAVVRDRLRALAAQLPEARAAAESATAPETLDPPSDDSLDESSLGASSLDASRPSAGAASMPDAPPPAPGPGGGGDPPRRARSSPRPGASPPPAAPAATPPPRTPAPAPIAPAPAPVAPEPLVERPAAHRPPAPSLDAPGPPAPTGTLRWVLAMVLVVGVGGALAVLAFGPGDGPSEHPTDSSVDAAAVAVDARLPDVGAPDAAPPDMELDRGAITL